MTPIVVAVVAVAFVLVVSALMVRRRHSHESHSVAGYRRTLDTLAGLGSDRPSGSRRRSGASAEEPDVPATRRPPPGRRPAPGPDPKRRWAFDDAGTGTSRPGSSRQGVSGRELGRASRPPGGGRRLLIGLAAAVIVVGLVIAVVALAGGHHPQNRSGATTTQPPQHPTTTTTLPAREQPVSSTATSATYAPPTADYALTLSATTANCWIRVTNAAGTTVFAQTLSAGSRHAVTVSGRVTVLLGAPTAAAVAVDHVPAVLPTGYGSPFTMTFTPSARAPAS